MKGPLQTLRQGEIARVGIDALMVAPVNGRRPLDADISNLIVGLYPAQDSLESRQSLVNETAAPIRDFRHGAPCNICQFE
ncbi:MAG: hypothetical protein QF375_01290 [Arenicellales bacterium]|jgi:hypothetical protein|nr:hypothetical protein [Arenicellales bacterium]MDP6854608.1 hypothetical protein [Arenicellales bacterium]MDP6947570.1 hypothetical protein [Arenicellales bacterium]|tara:strand:+ start:364 stop:603 length:240 start_codon:yes stop_codon:yes gene_type:complete